MILSWLTHFVEPDLTKGVIHAKIGHHVWVDFKDQFSQKECSCDLPDSKVLSLSLPRHHVSLNPFQKNQRSLG